MLSKHKYLLMSIGCFATFLLLALLSFWMEPTISRDGVMYLDLSRIWAETGSFDGVLQHWPLCWIPPFPLYLMKLLIDCGLSPAVAGVGLNIIMGSVLPLIVYMIGRLLFEDRRISLVAAFMMAVNPSMIEFAIEPQRDTIYLFFCGWLIYFIIKGLKQDSIVSFCGAGVFFALSMMTRYETLEMIPLFFFALLFCGVRKYLKWKRILLHITASVIIAGAVILSLTYLMGVKTHIFHNYQKYYQGQYIDFQEKLQDVSVLSEGMS